MTQTWTTPTTLKLPVNQWQFPDQDTYFFCDLHADAPAFLRSLKAGKLITNSSSLDKIELTSRGQNAQIIIGGDCFDKGPSNLALFKLINDVRLQNANLTILAGNHDIRFFAGLLALDLKHLPEQSHFFTRMGRKTAALFYEIYINYCQSQPPCPLSSDEIKQRLFPNDSWQKTFPEIAKDFMSPKKLAKELKQIEHKQSDFIEACQQLGMNLQQVYQAVEKARELFIEETGAFSWFLKELKLMHRNGSYLFCHAGLDDQMIQILKNQSIQEINQAMLKQLTQGELFKLYYSCYGNVFRTKYRESDFPLTKSGIQSLYQQGIFALVNGHRSHLNGQQISIREGLIHFECDTELNANCRQKSQLTAEGFSCTVFYKNGLVSAISSECRQERQFHPRQLQSA